MKARSSAGTTASASGVWKKKMYQDRFNWAGVLRKLVTIAAWCGTDIATSFVNRSGR